MTSLRKFKRCLGFGLLLSYSTMAVGQSRTYLALGDSISWGYQPNDVTRSAGDKGFVRLFADWLGNYYGVRPNLANLAIPGETSASYFDASEIGGLLNSNYPILFRPSQRSKCDSTITSALNAGRQIPYVTFEIGANDLLDMLDSTFLAQPMATQMQQADNAIQAAEARVTTALTALRQRLPSAYLLIPGYYNPYPLTRPEYPISTYAIPKLNEMLRTKARQFDGRFADVAPVFLGHEVEYTWIAEDDVHPRDIGYQKLFEELLSNIRLIRGTVTFGSIQAGTPMPTSLDFEITTPQTVFARTGDYLPDGTFRLTAPISATSISLKRTHWLRQARTVDTTTGDATGVVFVLMNGDIDGDNEVGVGDYALLSSAFGRLEGDPGFLAMADLDEDGAVEISDFAILSANFGQVGD